MLLDPRHWRLDDLLRRPLRDGERIGDPAGLHGSVAPGWGFAGPLAHPDFGSFAPFALQIVADGEPVAPGDGLFRPSHVTRHGFAADAGLQVVEDAFVDGSAAVSTLWLRNATDTSISVEVRVRWGLRGDGVCRLAPPGDDLTVRVPAGGRGRLPFVLAVGPDARRVAEGWFETSNAPLQRVESLQRTFSRSCGRFDCDDVYLTRLWYHRWRRPEAPLPGPSDTPRDSFERGDYDRPRADGPAWERHILERLVGWREAGEDTLRLEPEGDALGLRHWCLDDHPWGERRVSVVWDDPAFPDDVYDDGDRGFSVYVDRRRVFHADAPTAVTWEPEAPDDFDDF